MSLTPLSVGNFSALDVLQNSPWNGCMKMRDYRDLEVWQRSMGLAHRIYSATGEFPKQELFGLVGQLRRAAVSIPSNIAEGQGRDPDKSFALFLTQARGSLYEQETQLELSRNLGLLDARCADELLANAIEISCMLHGLQRRLRGTAGAPSR